VQAIDAYIAEQLSIIAGTPVVATDDTVARVWAQLNRTEERSLPRDRHGNVDFHDLTLARLGLLEDPPLHAEIAQSAGAEPRWPNGHRFAAVLSHDVDYIVLFPWRERLRQAVALQRIITPWRVGRRLAAAGVYALLSGLGLSRAPAFDPWVDAEARHGFRSTFFMLPEHLAAPTDLDHFYHFDDRIAFRGRAATLRQATRALHAEGWEIGLHGSYNAAYDGALLRDEAAQVASLVDAPVVSVRQHFLRFDRDVTPAAQLSAGLQVDSTLGFSRTIGCRTGLAFPFFWPDGDLLEVPLTIQDVGLLRGIGHRRNVRRAQLARARALIARIARAGGVVTLSWHTHPEMPGALEVYQALLETVAELDGWGCTLGEMNAWWRARRARLQRAHASAREVA
jgi:hypothetical protein